MTGTDAGHGQREHTEGAMATAWRRWRKNRPPAQVVHLGTAAAGRCSTATLRAAAGHAEQEAATGAYVAHAQAQPMLEAGRAGLADLLSMPAAGLVFTESCGCGPAP